MSSLFGSKRFSVFFSFCTFLILTLASHASFARSEKDIQKRMDADLAAGKPLVAHLLVALADNENQGIVPVSKSLGNGQDPSANLYWGAFFGVKTHFKKSGWELLEVEGEKPTGVLERVVFKRSILRNGKSVPVYVVADAWDGKEIVTTFDRFLKMSAGILQEKIVAKSGTNQISFEAGAKAHFVGYVGHNLLLDLDINTLYGLLKSLPTPETDNPEKSVMVLACASKPFLKEGLSKMNVHALLLTTNLMAPEAYTIDALLKTWFAGGSAQSAFEAAADSYRRYQKIGIKGARNLFYSEMDAEK